MGSSEYHYDHNEQQNTKVTIRSGDNYDESSNAHVVCVCNSCNTDPSTNTANINSLFANQSPHHEQNNQHNDYTK